MGKISQVLLFILMQISKNSILFKLKYISKVSTLESEYLGKIRQSDRQNCEVIYYINILISISIQIYTVYVEENIETLANLVFFLFYCQNFVFKLYLF